MLTKATARLIVKLCKEKLSPNLEGRCWGGKRIRQVNIIALFLEYSLVIYHVFIRVLQQFDTDEVINQSAT